MIHRKTDSEKVLFHSMNRAFTVTAIATSDEEANQHMQSQRGKDDAVIACFGPFVIMANKYDNGRRCRAVEG